MKDIVLFNKALFSSWKILFISYNPNAHSTLMNKGVFLCTIAHSHYYVGDDMSGQQHGNKIPIYTWFVILL